MPHQFTTSTTHDLQGTWLKTNGRKFCDWCYDQSTGMLQSRRGVVIRTTNLESMAKPLDKLKHELPKLALNLAKEQGSGFQH